MEIIIFLMFLVYVSSVVFHIRDSCPADVVGWNTRKLHFNCSKTEFYHCLLDERNRSGEFCTSERPSRVQKGFCPKYNNHSGKITTERCNVRHGCPIVPFDSNEVYRYQACLHINERKPAAGGEDASNSPWPIIIGISVGAGVIIASVIAILCYIRRRQQQGRRQEEEVPLLNASEEPFYKTSAFHEALKFVQKEGKILCFRGRWGSGKTTTAKQVYLSVTGRKPLVIENIAEFDVSSCTDCVIIEEPFSKSMSNVEVENVMCKIKTLCSEIGNIPGNFAIFTSSDEEWKRLSNGIKRVLMELEIVPMHDIGLNYESLSSGDRNQILHSIFSYYNPTKYFTAVEKVVGCN